MNLRPIFLNRAFQGFASLVRNAIFLSCGDGELGPLDGPDTGPFDQETEAFDEVLNRSLAAEMRRRDVSVSTHFYRGTHQPPYWERELHHSLPMLLAAIGGGRY